MDALENCRGVAVVDALGDGHLGLACGNWQVHPTKPKFITCMAVFIIIGFVPKGKRSCIDKSYSEFEEV